MKGYMNDAGELNLDDDDAMEFHYFKLHDYDNNDKLDGLELAAAMTHYHEEGDGGNSANEKIHVSHYIGTLQSCSYVMGKSWI